MQISCHLTVGHTYSRKELAQKFGIKDATIFTGIFRPKGHESIWLFVTQEKTADRTQYKDELSGDDLYIERQKSGRKDKLLSVLDPWTLKGNGSGVESPKPLYPN